MNKLIIKLLIKGEYILFGVIKRLKRFKKNYIVSKKVKIRISL